MKKVGIFTWHKIDNAYSCLWYLKEALEEICEVDIYAFNEKNRFTDPHYFSLSETWYGNIRRFRIYAAKFDVWIRARMYDVVIVNDIDFFSAAYYLKKMYPNKIIVDYHTELYSGDVTCPISSNVFYKAHANYPDMIIECLPERADYRKKQYNIHQNIFVINNTLPLKNVKKMLEPCKETLTHYIPNKNNLPTLIYAGGCNLSRSLRDIIDSAALFKGKLNYLFFCYGSETEFARVSDLCAHHDNCYIYKAVDKGTLFQVMSECDIGVQYYDPDYSINHYYAAPSKFYEYVAMGLNVVSSNNCGIDRIIQENNLGVCFGKEEGIVGGLEKLFQKGLQSHTYIQEIFEKKLCYEVDSEKTIHHLKKMIER